MQSTELGGRTGRELVHLDDTRETGRLLSRYCSMYNNLGAAQRRTPFASPRAAANLIPRGGSGREKGEGMVSRARFTRGIALYGGSSEVAVFGGQKRAGGGWLQAKGSAWRLHRVANHLNCGWSYARASSTPGRGWRRGGRLDSRGCRRRGRAWVEEV